MIGDSLTPGKSTQYKKGAPAGVGFEFSSAVQAGSPAIFFFFG